MSPAHFDVWTKKILADYKQGLDLKAGFLHLESEKCYGGLDYAVFFEGAKPKEDYEKVWKEVLDSAINGGRKSISARSAKTLNSFGGMQWLRDSNRDEVQWYKKNFLDSYKNTPSPDNIDFKCPGLSGEMYLENKKQGLLNG